MIVIPAVDIKGGLCVRLLRGRAEEETVYFKNPTAPAKKWMEGGAEMIHVVDLDGAFTGKMANIVTIGNIIREVKGVRVEVGGGVRTEEDVRRLLDLGAYRVSMGTVAAESPDRLRELCEKFPGKIAVGVDAERDKVAIQGWTSTTDLDLLDFVRDVGEAGAAAIIYTDIYRDGTLLGPNMERTREVCKASSIPVVASGGVSSLDDLKRLSEIPLEGAIVGKALFEEIFTLQEAIAAVGGGSKS
jgi:phosphoribosylformimino-5-aminoimidazole carboxamide ribotide isomerase